MKPSIYFLLVTFVFVQSVTAQGDTSKTIKALWVVRDILKSKNDIEKMLDDAEKAHITDLFIQVRGRSDAYYKSAFVPLAEGLEGSFDPLEFLLNKSQGRFRIHAWINVVYLWSAESKPTSQEHLLFKRPEWSAVSKSGTSMISEGLKKLKEKNKEGFFVSPANSEFQEYFIKVVSELVNRYKIDGVHLDYIRYAGKEYDYSDAIRSKFILTYNADPLLLDSAKGAWAGRKDQKSWFDKVWSDFRRNEITQFVSHIREAINSVRPNVLLSAAVWADLNMAQLEMFQEWPEWIKKGSIDLAVPMNYAADNSFENRIKDAKVMLGDSLFLKKVIMGISMYNQSSSAMNEKVTICKKYKLRGISFFSYESVRKDKAYFKKMAEAGF